MHVLNLQSNAYITSNQRIRLQYFYKFLKIQTYKRKYTIDHTYLKKKQ